MTCVLAYFQEQLRADAFAIDEAYFRVAERYPLEDIERLSAGSRLEYDTRARGFEHYRHRESEHFPWLCRPIS